MDEIKQAIPVDGIKYVSKEAFEAYVHDPFREELQRRSGLTDEEIQGQQRDMLSGRRDVTWRNFIVRVEDETHIHSGVPSVK